MVLWYNICIEKGFFMMKKIPNYLTTFRIILVAVLVLVWMLVNPAEAAWFTIGTSPVSVSRFVLFVIFTIAALTDFLDGYLARKYKVVSTYGKLMDPIADKLLVNTTLILFAVGGELPVLIPILMISRDTFVDALRMIMAERQIVVAAGPWGKAKTVLQILGIMLVFMFGFPFHTLVSDVGIYVLWGATLISVYSGLDYYLKSKGALHE